MAPQLETELARTMSAAAENAPPSKVPLLDNVQRLYRRRTRRRAVVASVATLAVLGAGALVALGPGRSLVVPPATGPTFAVQRPRPVQQVWPKAVHQVPTTLPDGRRYGLAGVLDGKNLVVGTGPLETPENPLTTLRRVDQLLRFNVATGSTTVLATSSTAGTDAGPGLGDVAIGDRYLAWVQWLPDPASPTPGTSYRMAQLWAAPRAGGTPVLVATVDTGPATSGAGISDGKLTVRVAGNELVWQLSDVNKDNRPLGIYRAPATGGAATRVPGTDGYHIVSWPWVGKPNLDELSGPGYDGQFENRELYNVETGVRITASTADSAEHVRSCGPIWCVGYLNRPGVNTIDFVQRVDGSGYAELPDLDKVMGGPSHLMGPPLLDRFANAGDTLIDLKTGRSARFGISMSKKADSDGSTIYSASTAYATDTGGVSVETRYLWWITDNGRTMTILDLAAV